MSTSTRFAYVEHGPPNAHPNDWQRIGDPIPFLDDELDITEGVKEAISRLDITIHPGDTIRIRDGSETY